MRILRLQLEDGDELDLHPYVTVLGGLAPGSHERVAERLVRLARGDATGLAGLVEVKDLLVELEPDALASLDLPPDADVLVRAEQLPGAHAVDGGVTAELDGRIASLRSEIDSLQARRSEAGARVAVVTAELDDARHGLDEFAISAHDTALAAVTAAESAVLAEIHGGHDADHSDERTRLVAALDAARDDAAAFEAELDAERLDLLETFEELERQRATRDELRAGAASEPVDDGGPPPPSAGDLEAVARALEAVRRGPPEAPLQPSPEAIALADEIAAHGARHDELESELRDEGIDVVELQRQLTDAVAEAERAEVAARPIKISPADDAEIERLHDIVVDEGERRSSRRGGKGAERAWEEASEALDALLERIGYPTYAAYVMGRLSPAVDPEARRRKDEADARVAEVEAELDQMAAVLERDSRVLVLRAERDQLWAAARDLLGTLPDDVEGGLRALRVPGEVPHTALDGLRSLLQQLGISTAPDEVSVVAAAETLLADAALEHDGSTAAGPETDEAAVALAAAERHVAELERLATDADAALTRSEQESGRRAARVLELEGALADLDAARAAGEAAGALDDPASDPRVQADPRVVAAREQAAGTESRLARHHAVVERVDTCHAHLRAARAAEREASSARDAALSELAEVEEVRIATLRPEIEWVLDERGVEAIEWYLLGRVSSLRQVSHAGSVPLILDDAFRGLPAEHVRKLCDAMAGIAETVQVIYLGDQPDVIAWAEATGLDVVAMVRPGQPAV